MNTWTMPWWAWLFLGLALLGFELLTPGGFFLLFFGAGAMLVGLLAAAGIAETLWVQWLLFSALSLGALAMFRKPLLRKFEHTAKREVDTLVGETAIASQSLSLGETGKVEMRGTTWSAQNVGERPLKVGERCSVVGVEGLTLRVRGE